MVHKPALPDDYDLPETVGEWTLDPQTGKNAHAWYSDARTEAVAIYSTLGTVSAKVSDERVNGLRRNQTLTETELEDDDLHTTVEDQAVAAAVDVAIDWMQSTAPDDWSHPNVNEAVFDPPEGYVLDWYHLELRNTLIYYRLEGSDERSSLRHNRPPADVTDEEYPYLVIRVWRGSGNATIFRAPWTRAHDNEMVEVVDPPEECGLDVALKYSREYVEGEDAEVTSGQTGLGQFATDGGGQA